MTTIVALPVAVLCAYARPDRFPAGVLLALILAVSMFRRFQLFRCST